MSEFVGVVTNIGQQKIAAAIGGAALNLTTIRVGDGNGAAITPAPAMTDLVRRVGGAYPIISSGRDATNLTHWRVTALIPAADGPFDIREIAVFDQAGDMIAIAKHVLVEKRSPDQGAAVELTTDVVFPVSDTAQVTVQIQPSAAVSILQMLRAGFCTVDSAQIANPPANSALGATYVVAANPTGAWAGLTNRLAQWNGTVWVSVDVPAGFVVVAQDRAEDHDSRWLRRVANGWASGRATDSSIGLIELATAVEVQALQDAVRAVTPATLATLTATAQRSGLVKLASAADITNGTEGPYVDAASLHTSLFGGSGFSNIKQPKLIAQTASQTAPIAITSLTSWSLLYSELGDATFNLNNGLFTAGANTLGMWLFLGYVAPDFTASATGSLSFYSNAPMIPVPAGSMTSTVNSSGGFAPHVTVAAVVLFTARGQTVQLSFAQSTSSPTVKGRFFGIRIAN